jgi:ATP-dependent DNA helicase RecG
MTSPALADIVGGRTATALAKQLDLHTVDDLLHFYPRRYAERGQLTRLDRLSIGDDVTVMATVASAKVIPMRQRKGRLLEVIVTDGHSRLGITFFNQAWRERELTPGRSGLFAGRVSEFNHKRKLNNPEYLLLDAQSEHAHSDLPQGDPNDTVDEFAGTLIPVYPATSKLPSWVIGRSVRVLLDRLPVIVDPLPAAVRQDNELVDLDSALRAIHRPGDRAAFVAARRRLAWDEALGVQLTLALRRQAAEANPAQPRPRRPGGLADAFEARLPFTLTAGQQEVGAEIAADLDAAHPMHRLLQGEVGSGKTIVALRAMLQVIDNGAQAALLAPTEVLAAQHARSIEAMLGDLAQAGRFGAGEQATRITLLTGSLPTAARRQALLDAASGVAGIVIGTHALIQKTVQFADLGLVVVDEQHRFGVEQRDALRAKASTPPHLLVMTATPIPRTVAMTVFGDLDTSTLAELPAGRSPITTSVVPVSERPAWLDRAWARVAEEVAAGRQAYVVCPAIGDGSRDDEPTPDEGGFDEIASSGSADPLADTDLADTDLAPADADPSDGAGPERTLRTVLDTAAELTAGPLAGLRLATLHGRLPGEEKDRIMRAFSDGEIDVLVATTVIEVGVDVPNATVMVVLDAERYGVSQLHQLRGRVGRGREPGLCLLVTNAEGGGPARVRLDAIAASTDGFALAYLDLEQRREGDILGASQSGRRSHLKLLSLLRDEELIGQARSAAAALIAADPDLSGLPLLAAQVAALVDEERGEYLEKA